MTETGDGHALYYNDDLVTNLQLRWGDGFLSPGGEAEIARMLRGLDLSGKHGLDFGCGIGGYDFVLVNNHGVTSLVGIDIDGRKIEAAKAAASDRALDDRIEFVKVAPGPLSFEDGAFDFVFSKDSIVELPEKISIFAELFRLVRPDGLIILSDWFRGDAPYTDEMRRWATTGDETYEMDSLSKAASYVEAAGFVDVELDDRNDWFRDFAKDEYERLKGPLYPVYVQKFGKEQATTSVENARIRSLLAEQGQLRPGHIRARKP